MLDGVVLDLAALGIAQFVHQEHVSSTMDVAHALASDGAPHGTVIVADVQAAGRGRSGKRWHSAAPDGLWMTWLLRDVAAEALGLLSLRTGLAIASAVVPHTDAFVGLKWPNDVYAVDAADVHAARTQPWSALGKLAGVLVETRWREQSLDWVAIGIGINRRVPAAAEATGVLDGRRVSAVRATTSRAALLAALAPTLQALGSGAATLAPAELAAWAARDVAVGRRATAPGTGRVVGVAADGSLQLAPADASITTHRSGSLEFAD